MKKTIKLIALISFLFFAFNHFLITIRAQDDDNYLSNMSNDECIEFVNQNNITIPTDIQNPGSIIHAIFMAIENDLDYIDRYNHYEYDFFVNSIIQLAKDYYHISNNGLRDNNDYVLSDSLVEDNGVWQDTGGDWLSKWEDYNCYAYALTRTEHTPFYNTTFQYQQGDFSQNINDKYTLWKSVQNVANSVGNDLEALGYDVDYIGTQMPTIINDNQELICVRTGYSINYYNMSDYHFMKYDKETNCWYHKPSTSAVLKYKYEPSNERNWTNERSIEGVTYAPSIVYSGDIYFILYSRPFIKLNCYASSSIIEDTIDDGYDCSYKIQVDCTGMYVLSSTAEYPISMTFYNSDMDEISSIIPVMTNNNCTGTINANLNEGTYYLRINYVNSTDSGTITTSFETTNPNVGIPISINTNTNIKQHLHNQASGNYLSRATFTNTNGPGYYKFRLNAGSNVTYPVGAIRIYTDSNRQNLLSRYSVSGIYSNAFSNYNENEMYVYLPENGTYYIDIVMPNNNYNILTLYIERSDINNFDYTNTLAFQSFTPLFENQSTQNYFEEVTISHRSKFSLEVLTSGIVTSSMPVYIFQKVLEPGNEPGVYNYYPVRVSNPNWYITAYNSNPIYNIVLEAGTYYFGYDLNSNNVDISFCLRRVVDYEASSLATLITDPALNQGYTLGSEVNFNGGLPLDTTITEGFTRCIYLMFNNYIALPDSRLDYDWYSSNDNLASVTRYGTVLARPVNVDTNVTIYAVLKEDPSVVLSIQLTILNDVETEEIEIVSNLSYSYSTQNGTYQLALDNSNSPYPWISYYLWAITESNDYPNLEVEMNQWGYITSNGTGVAILTANYYLNPRVYLTIYLTITS